MSQEETPKKNFTPQDTSDDNLFRTLWPGMIKHTRLLLVDYDVCRYHSFDQLRWQLMVDSRDGDYLHFASLRHNLRPLLDGSTDWADQVQFARQNVDRLNIYELFSKSPVDGPVDTRGDYEKKLHQMMCEEKQKVTPTDVNDRFGVIFDRRDITGFLLQYKTDINEPAFLDKVTRIQLNHILNMEIVASIVRTHAINAIMISSAEMALQLALILIKNGYKTPITFILGRYAYNYYKDQTTGKLRPRFNSEMGELEIALHYEFGFFDPFTGLTYKSRLENQMKQQMEET